jgi:uncharacterized SAM-binding protein YcdF (DUF218 family)
MMMLSPTMQERIHFLLQRLPEWNKTNQCESVIVVTQFYHVTRSKYIFRKLGIKNVHNVSSDYFD